MRFWRPVFILFFLILIHPTHTQNLINRFSAAVDTSWVRHYTPGLLSGADRANKVNIDRTGHVYISGYANGRLTLKYDLAGNKIWNITGFVVAIDDMDNTYINMESDSVLAKYSWEGVELWRIPESWELSIDIQGNVYAERDSSLYKYNNLGILQWQIFDCYTHTVDNNSNIYIAGKDSTYKYNSKGVKQWSVFRNLQTEVDNFTDRRPAYIDTLGNVYYAGSTYQWGTWLDYFSIKFDSLGVEQWITRFDGPAGLRDYISDFTVDQHGNVYITGLSGVSGTQQNTNYDFGTVKYNASGEEQWRAYYHGPSQYHDYGRSLYVDEQGNVYVTGESGNPGTDYDYAIVKYDSSGVEQWAARYNGPGNGPDEAKDVSVDKLGNVFVTGGSMGTVTDRDYATIKYNSSGIEQWIRRYNGPLRLDIMSCADAAVDGSGNIYVTGSISDPLTAQDYITIKYNSSGVIQWSSRYNGIGAENNVPSDLDLDNSGNVYVTGSTVSGQWPEESIAYTTVKYNSEGNEEWGARYDGGKPVGIATDFGGNIYVSGSNGTVKYNSDGIEQWAILFSLSEYQELHLNDFAVDDAGNVYITGGGYSQDQDYDYITLKYNTNGIEQWTALFSSPGFDMARAIRLDGEGNVYVSGDSDSDSTIVKYNASGVEQWVAVVNQDYRFGIEDMVVDAEQNVFVTGSRIFGGGWWGGVDSSQCVTVKYDKSGNEQWVAVYKGNETSVMNEAKSLTLDELGNVYITGTSEDSGGFKDIITLRYDSNGSEVWAVSYPTQAEHYEKVVSAIKVPSPGIVYIAGISSDENEYHLSDKYNNIIGIRGNKITLIKYSDKSLPIHNQGTYFTPNKFILRQNYPNPFNSSTIIEYNLPKASNVTIELYNIAGQKIQTILNEKMPAGNHQVKLNAQNLASGVYFYRIGMCEFQDVKKMVLLK